MYFSLDDRTCAMSVSEFAGFTLGPRDAGQGGSSGLWRAQLGQEWHARLRARTETEVAAKNHDQTRADAAFEVPLTLPCIHRGWTFKLTGRIDQLVTVFDVRNPEAAAKCGGSGGVQATEAAAESVLPRQLPQPEVAPVFDRRDIASRRQTPLCSDSLPAEASAKSGEPPTGKIVGPRDDVDGPSHRIEGGRRAKVSIIIREIKTVSGPLPGDEVTLRTDYPEYFLQAIAYLALLRSAPRSSEDRPELEAAGDPGEPLRLDLGLTAGSVLQAELVFVEIGTGITQTVALGVDDETSFRTQLERLAEFLDLQVRARDRLRGLQFRPAFRTLRPGQETVQNELLAAFGEVAAKTCGGSDPASPGSPYVRHSPEILFFEAPTGYGKTGVLLEFALGRLRAGRFGRLLYLTGKSTGQLQVMRTLAGMCEPGAAAGHEEATAAAGLRTAVAGGVATPVAAWQVRPKAEHCVNSVYHCVRDACPYLADLETRWKHSGLARFYLLENQPHDLEALRAAGRDARLCPYEITRAALPFNDVWIGDYNYVFAPDTRGIFFDRPGFDPGRTLLIVDEAHNLPARVADAYSHVARAGDAEFVLTELHRIRTVSPLLLAWEQWTRLLSGLRHTEGLELAAEDDVRDAIDRLATLVANTPLDYAALGPGVSEHLWKTLALRDWLAGEFGDLPDQKSQIPNQESKVPTLLWCARAGELHFTCLDAAALIGPTLRAFGGVILASATLQPAEVFAANCGLDDVFSVPARPDSIAPPAALGKLSRRARKALRDLTSGAELLKVEEVRESAGPHLLCAAASWRDNAYAVGVDARVDTTFQHRVRFYPATAATVETLLGAARGAVASRSSPVDNRTDPAAVANRLSPPTIAVFFPSYAYADHIISALQAAGSAVRVALQPRGADLALQAAWVENSLTEADALFLVLGSSFAESIDLLGGRVTHAMVVGPALPEVNAIQHSRLAELERTGLSRTAAFRRVYQIPGMQKVNQALGRLVRAPGQQARVLLHCRRFADPSYATLLSAEYRHGVVIRSDEELTGWLQGQT